MILGIKVVRIKVGSYYGFNDDVAFRSHTCPRHEGACCISSLIFVLLLNLNRGWLVD